MFTTRVVLFFLYVKVFEPAKFSGKNENCLRKSLFYNKIKYYTSNRKITVSRTGKKCLADIKEEFNNCFFIIKKLKLIESS